MVKYPITSYGIILYTEENPRRYLLYKRRDSFQYIDFIRGNWSSVTQVTGMLAMMFPEERERLINYTFKELWDDLWVDHSIRVYTEGYEHAENKYSQIVGNLKFYIEHTQVDDPGRESLWGFPKGRKNGNEKNLQCAIREFHEETKIPIECISVIDTPPIQEFFTGTNGKSYSTCYYIASVDKAITTEYMDTKHCIRDRTVSEEACEIVYLTLDEACKRLNSRRETILRQVDERLRTSMKQ